MVYVDPYKLLSRQLSVMDVVDAVNKNNLILPAGDVKMGPYDYYVYSNSLVEQGRRTEQHTHQDRRRELGLRLGCWGGEGCQPDPVQHRARRWQRSVYLPIMKQGGDTNTIEVVNGIRDMIGKLLRHSQAA
jgi:multidrug efflux pump subunit AcrB